ncbi:hypothetical protein ACH5RR_015834 [Cinchona calisaya]|uniref:Protein PHLOEM PROTEIN 2-LIKE A9-like n=1 Tax=Cinchona calisaya TaxID=153742 RepID=A0ABD2ZXC9_9GENT
MVSNNPHYEADPKAIEYNKGQELIIVKPRGLNIVWGRDARYWNVPNPEDDGKPAELLQVSWLEVTGCVSTDPQKNYEVGFKVSLTPDAFGWGGSPIYIMVKRGKEGKFVWKENVLTNNPHRTNEFYITTTLVKSDRQAQGSTDRKIYFGLYEVWSDKWKGGLKVHHVRIKEV